MKPTALIILDGWGYAPPGPGNAVEAAKKPNFDKFWSLYPHCLLIASGEAVGLPHGERGNSEVGHLNLGAGRIVYQDLPRINMAIADGSYLKNTAFLSAILEVKKNNSRLHLLTLVGNGNIHASQEHLYALLWLCREQGLNGGTVKLHLFTDGRDTPPTSALGFIKELKEKFSSIGVGEIATVSGRFYAMDRDNRWERTQKVHQVQVLGQGEKIQDVTLYLEKMYQKDITDEFIPPAVVERQNKPVGLIKDNDAVIFLNFRADRARQLTYTYVLDEEKFNNLELETSFIFEHFSEKTNLFIYRDETRPFLLQSKKEKIKTFKRQNLPRNLFFVTMTEYEKNLPVSAIAFSSFEVSLPLSRVLAEQNLSQFHIAETEKYPHVTYFFNGGREEPFSQEERMVVSSPKVKTYDQKPQMSAREVTEIVLEKIRQDAHHFIIVNFANPDMVGHTGVLKAGVKACEVTDVCLGQIVNTILARGGSCIISADHGNVEEMVNLQTGEVDTEHSVNPVPCILIAQGLKGKSQTLPIGILADVAPTLLEMMGVRKPSVMTGRNLLK